MCQPSSSSGQDGDKPDGQDKPAPPKPLGKTPIATLIAKFQAQQPAEPSSPPKPVPKKIATPAAFAAAPEKPAPPRPATVAAIAAAAAVAPQKPAPSRPAAPAASSAAALATPKEAPKPAPTVAKEPVPTPVAKEQPAAASSSSGPVVAPVSASPPPEPKPAALAKPTCDVCYNDDPDDWITYADCKHTLCTDCMARSKEFWLLSTKACVCRGLVHYSVYEKIATKDQMLVVMMNYHRATGDWLDCPFGGCSGGAPGKEREDSAVRCLACNRDFCSVCKVDHAGQSCAEYKRSQAAAAPVVAPAAAAAVEEQEENEAWGGLIHCPNCKAPIMVDWSDGCDVITCGNPKCKARFNIAGGEANVHTFKARDFAAALASFSARTGLGDLNAVLEDYAGLARTYHLPQLITKLGQMKLANTREEVEAVIAAVGFPAGFKEFLRQHFLPVDPALARFNESLAAAATLAQVAELLATQAELAGDLKTVQAIMALGQSNPGELMLNTNKIKDNAVKRKVKAILKL